MWQLLAAVLLTAGNVTRTEVTVRVENWTGCAVRVQVMQRGAVRQSLFVENARTVTERVHVPSQIDPVGFRVIGIGCPFSRYTVEPLNHFETALVLRLHRIPIHSYLLPFRSPR
jgi:hypothetical protein